MRGRLPAPSFDPINRVAPLNPRLAGRGMRPRNRGEFSASGFLRRESTGGKTRGRGGLTGVSMKIRSKSPPPVCSSAFFLFPNLFPSPSEEGASGMASFVPNFSASVLIKTADILFLFLVFVQETTRRPSTQSANSINLAFSKRNLPLQAFLFQVFIAGD